MRALPAALLLLAAAAPPLPVYRSFGHWVVACDNTRSCEARGFDDGADTDLRVNRAAGDAPASVTINENSHAPDRDTVRLDGAAMPLRPPAWVAGAGDDANPGSLSTGDPDAVRRFVAVARTGHVLQLDRDDEHELPLDGMTAALLFMDATQGRRGTPAPLVAPAGSARALPPLRSPRVPLPTRAPPVGDAEARRLLARLDAARPLDAADCDHAGDPDVYALDRAHALVVRPCSMAAYQGSSIVDIVPRNGRGAPAAVVLRLPGLPASAATIGPGITEPSFDPDKGELSLADKGNGLGQSGLFATWIWSGRGFRLVDFEYLDRNDGAAPGDFPVLFRSAGRS